MNKTVAFLLPVASSSLYKFWFLFVIQIVAVVCVEEGRSVAKESLLLLKNNFYFNLIFFQKKSDDKTFAF